VEQGERPNMPKTNLISIAKVSKVEQGEGSKKVGTSLQIYGMLKEKTSITRRGIGENKGRFKVKRSNPNKKRKERNN
jgi:hypothetical protein